MGHFLGKRNLEVYTVRLPHKERPKINVFAVNSELYRAPTWDKFKGVIRASLGDTSEQDADKIINSLHEIAIGEKKLEPAAQRSLYLFQGMVTRETETCALYMHCEAVVAALLQLGCNQPTVSCTNPDSKSDLTPLAKLSEVRGFA